MSCKHLVYEYRPGFPRSIFKPTKLFVTNRSNVISCDVIEREVHYLQDGLDCVVVCEALLVFA